MNFWRAFLRGVASIGHGFSTFTLFPRKKAPPKIPVRSQEKNVDWERINRLAHIRALLAKEKHSDAMLSIGVYGRRVALLLWFL